MTPAGGAPELLRYDHYYNSDKILLVSRLLLLSPIFYGIMGLLDIQETVEYAVIGFKHSISLHRTLKILVNSDEVI